MFNLYYINYAKAFEIAMQIDNKIPEKIIVDSESRRQGEGGGDINTRVPLLDKILPTISADFRYSVSKADKTSDTLKVISTKSTLLELIMQTAVEIRKIGNDRVGNLIKLKDIMLSIDNVDDMMGVKVLLSGILKQVPVEGLGNIDISDMMDVMLKGASYIAVGKMPEKIALSDNATDKLLIKVPLQMGNEMESQYSISDLEIGPVTVVGIYRGVHKYEEIRKQVDIFKQLESGEKTDFDIEKDNENECISEEKSNKIHVKDDEKVHFIDVIAIVQDLYY